MQQAVGQVGWQQVVGQLEQQSLPLEWLIRCLIRLNQLSFSQPSEHAEQQDSHVPHVPQLLHEPYEPYEGAMTGAPMGPSAPASHAVVINRKAAFTWYSSDRG